MVARRRREFLADVGRGVLIAGVGYATALDMGFTRALADDTVPESLTFGHREPLVRLMQDTAPDRLMPILIQQWKSGTSVNDLVAAAALANARTFGGEDYIGFHTLMALTPAFHMAHELPTEQSLLPVLKVLYRNSARIQEHGGHDSELLHPIALPTETGNGELAEQIRQAVFAKDRQRAESLLAHAAHISPEKAFNDLLEIVQENAEVHRVVMPYRAWDLLDIVGQEHAFTLLRQSVRYCVKSESNSNPNYARGGARALPGLFDQYGLMKKPAGNRAPDEAWIDHLSRTIFNSTPEQAAEAVAAALAEGFAPDSIGEAVTLAANQLLLRDAGRPPEQSQANKPPGSVHGDSIGVHACDSANAWRNMARISSARNQAACLMLGAWQVSHDRTSRGGDFLNWQPWPLAEHAEKLAADKSAQSAEGLMSVLNTSIRGNDQATACAAVQLLAKTDHSPRAIFDVLLRYAISEDGALHAEKYYRTVSQEFATTRPAFRWRHIEALARVTASEYGKPAPGVAEAKEMLNV